MNKPDDGLSIGGNCCGKCLKKVPRIFKNLLILYSHTQKWSKHNSTSRAPQLTS